MVRLTDRYGRFYHLVECYVGLPAGDGVFWVATNLLIGVLVGSES